MLLTRQLITLWAADNQAKATANSYQREIIFIIAHVKILCSILGSAYCHQIILFLRILICLPRVLYFYFKKICERIHSLCYVLEKRQKSVEQVTCYVFLPQKFV